MTPLLRLYARLRRRQLARQSPETVQRRVLRRLIRRAAHTRFGRDHGFARIRDIHEFQRAVPLRRYEDFLVKEGVGAGAAAVLAALLTNTDGRQLLAAIERVYEEIYGLEQAPDGA